MIDFYLKNNNNNRRNDLWNNTTATRWKNTDKDTAKIMNKLARPLLSHGWAQGLIEI